MKKSLKDNLKNQYEQEFEVPSQDLWSRLEDKLEENEQSPETKKQNLWMIWIAASIVVFVTVGIMISNFVDKPIQQIKPVLAENNSVEIKDERIQNTIVIGKTVEENTTKKEVIDNFGSSYKVEKQNVKTEIFQKNNIKETSKLAENKPLIKSDTSKNKVAPLGSPVLANQQNIENPKKEKYITADDLLFGREVDKAYQEQKKNQSKNLGVSIQKPKEVKVLGFTVYTEE